MMHIFTDFSNLSVAVCARHRHLAYEKGWSFLQEEPRKDEWPCYFADFHRQTFWHSSKGQIFSSRNMTSELQEEATTLPAYRAIIRRSYDNLRGVKFGVETALRRASDEDHDLERPARLVAKHLLTEEAASEACCCMAGYNGCCATCHNTCPMCDGVGRLDHGAGPACHVCDGTGNMTKVALS